MFARHDPNADLIAQQTIFGSRTVPEPEKKSLFSRLFRRRKPAMQTAPQKSEPVGELIRNALYSDIPGIAPDYPILSNPKSEKERPEKFMIISLVEDDPDAVQIELVTPDIADARYELLQITTKIERGETPKVRKEGIHLKSDRTIVYTPTLPGVPAAACRLMPGRKPALGY